MLSVFFTPQNTIFTIALILSATVSSGSIAIAFILLEFVTELYPPHVKTPTDAVPTIPKPISLECLFTDSLKFFAANDIFFKILLFDSLFTCLLVELIVSSALHTLTSKLGEIIIANATNVDKNFFIIIFSLKSLNVYFFNSKIFPLTPVNLSLVN